MQKFRPYVLPVAIVLGLLLVILIVAAAAYAVSLIWLLIFWLKNIGIMLHDFFISQYRIKSFEIIRIHFAKIQSFCFDYL